MYMLTKGFAKILNMKDLAKILNFMGTQYVLQLTSKLFLANFSTFRVRQSVVTKSFRDWT